MYRIYVTDSLKIVAENVAKCAVGGGTTLNKRYIEIVDDSKPKPQKTAEQVIDEVIKNAGLEVIG